MRWWASRDSSPLSPPAAAVVALLPLLAALQQLPSPVVASAHGDRDSNNHDIHLVQSPSDVLAAVEQAQSLPPSSSADPTISPPRVRSTDSSALATLALAGSAPAVRAPPAQIRSHDDDNSAASTAGHGHSANAGTGAVRRGGGTASAPQLQARSLQDWEVEDFVLLATVDGTIHARDRSTGAHRWALEVPDSPAVESIYHRANQSTVHVAGATADGAYGGSSGRSSSSSNNSGGGQPEDDYLWLVEPSRDGSLYIYHPGPDGGGGLQRLGLTVKSLVDGTPYSGTDPPVTYTARKETTLYTVDARSGAILRVFSSHGPVPTEKTCRRLNELEETMDNVEQQEEDDDDDEDAECGSPSRTLVLGRIEYTVAIQNTETGMPICTLKYSEWGPNNRDADLQSQYFKTMDDRHIYSMHDGVIFGFDHSKVDGRRYTQKLPSPVVRVFDIARPAADGDSSDDTTPLIMLAQPPSDVDFGSSGLEDRDSRVFVNCTEKHGWYAMSELTYPLVTGRARQAECYEKDFLATNQPLMSLTPLQQRAALIGVHSLAEHPSDLHHTIPSISGPPAAAAELSNDTPRRDLDSRSQQVPASPPAESRRGGPVQNGWNNVVDAGVTAILVVVAMFLYINSGTIREVAKQKLDLKHVVSARGDPSIPTTPVLPPETTATEAAREPAGLASDSEGTRLQVNEQGHSSTHFVTTEDDANDVSVSAEGVAEQQDIIDSVPRVTVQDGVPDGGDDQEETADKSPEKRKKARRGRRGGHKRGKKNVQENGTAPLPGSNDIDDNNKEQNSNENTLTPKPPPSMLRRPSSENAVYDVDGAIVIGQLKVYNDEVLGHGSHGTVVYKGSFDGRDVAVKRMLVEFYDVAAHEVGLLQQSDDHNNVIRYFCREQAAGFLYIALELCPASLQDVIERPHQYPDLVNADLGLPEILRQITSGVRYLHSLKIVHRDIKPQNILVASSKRPGGTAAAAAVSGGLRLLISDFGLCKKLDDNQSSFRATTAHAAGTSGWRAPELLVDDDQDPPASHGVSSMGDSSEPAVVDPQTNRRATRAIDIFSLGCIFYYVLTRGGHPFDKDGKFMREANIVKGYHNLDDLQRLGDYAFEADDLVRQMLARDPRRRPDATSVMIHPFFWTPTERLSFLCDVSDHFEFEPRDPPSPALLCLESVAPMVIGPEMDFLKTLPRDFKDSLGKQRKYTGAKMLDLLRALRNKRNHYNDMPDALKAHIGGLPVGYLLFWTVRFPSLLINCHWVVMTLGLTDTERFRRYFTPPI